MVKVVIIACIIYEYIGNEEALKLLEETKGIEAKGGMMAQGE